MAANPIRVLVVDDEPQIRRLLKTSLAPQNWQITEAGDAAAALKRVASEPVDLIILDLGLPDGSGLGVLEIIRKTSAVPVIILSARGDEAGKVQAFELGADDYVTKPFGMAELVARLRAALRHRLQEKGASAVVRCGAVAIDLVNRTVTAQQREIRLTPTEYDLLRLLAEHAGKVLTHRFILQSIWGGERTDDVHYLRVYIRALRQKLAPWGDAAKLIETEAGIGYRLNCPDPAAAP